MKKIIFIFLAALLVACDPDHTSEYNRINRDDIEGYEEFISKYPDSKHVVDARERIETAEYNRISWDDIEGYEEFISKYPSSKYVVDARERIKHAKEEQRRAAEQARIEERRRQLEQRYGYNSLSNGAQPYSLWYGENQYYDDYTSHSEIRVTAPSSSDVIAIVRYDNHNGKVAGHVYIKAGQTATIHLKNGFYYQTFFYYGKGWYPDKEMKNNIKGGFIMGEMFSKDGSPSYLNNNILTYELVLTRNGNFSTSYSNENEVF